MHLSFASARAAHARALALLAGMLAILAVACGAPAPPAASSTPAGAGAANVRLLTGGAHIVHHSDAPLPSVQAPRGDGKPTLVWFSATWCTTCASMEAWATDVGNEFSGRAAFVEKSVDHDRAAVARYTVRGTPTFVVIDASGNELARFFGHPSAAAFRAAIDDALRKGGV